jgi:hypothetical protein
MKKSVSLLILISTVLFFNSCLEGGQNTCQQLEIPDVRDERVNVTIDEGVFGLALYWQGDFRGICAQGSITKVPTRLHFYEPTQQNQTTILSLEGFYSEIRTERIGSTNSNQDGFFEIELEPGTYSVFAEDTDEGIFYSFGMDDTGFINTVVVHPDSVSAFQFNFVFEAIF